MIDIGDILIKVFYIFNNLNEVQAIFATEEHAREYLELMDIDISLCKTGIIPDNIFNFEEHDSRFHDFRDSNLDKRTHMTCRFSRVIQDNIGTCLRYGYDIDVRDECCSKYEE